MTDVLVVGIILLVLAIVILVWYAQRKRQAQDSPQMPLREFFVTLFAMMNSFVVIILAIAYTHGSIINPSWVIASALFALGLVGIVFAYLDAFRKRKARQDAVEPVAKGIKKPK
jgi:TRAP-type C4-dicarboxylate transport system permease large subunit